MHTYTSTKAMPYVYMGIHKITGEIYIGYREKNVKLGRTSSDDLPIYRTSSKVVKPHFGDYDWYIMAEFYEDDAAYDFEQQLIYEHWGNPLLLNKHCYFGKNRFKCNSHSEDTKRKISELLGGKPSPLKGKTLSEDHKRKLSVALIGKQKSEETKQNMSSARKGKPRSEEHKRNILAAHEGRVFSEETKRKISVATKGRVPWNKGMRNPTTRPAR